MMAIFTQQIELIEDRFEMIFSGEILILVGIQRDLYHELNST